MPHTRFNWPTAIQQDESTHRRPSASESTPPSRPITTVESNTSAPKSQTRRKVLSSVATITSVGLAGCGTDSTETTIEIRLTSAPEGVQKYECRLRQDGQTPITSVSSTLIDDDEFQIISGGVDSTSVTVRAADISESVTAFEDTQVVFTTTFDGEVIGEDISISVPTATDDTGNSIPGNRWQVVVVGST